MLSSMDRMQYPWVTWCLPPLGWTINCCLHNKNKKRVAIPDSIQRSSFPFLHNPPTTVGRSISGESLGTRSHCSNIYAEFLILPHINIIQSIWQAKWNKWAGGTAKMSPGIKLCKCNSKVLLCIPMKWENEVSFRDSIPGKTQVSTDWSKTKLWLKRYTVPGIASGTLSALGMWAVRGQRLYLTTSIPDSNPVPARESVQWKCWAHKQKRVLLCEVLRKQMTQASPCSMKLTDCLEH